MDSSTDEDFSQFMQARWPQLVRLGYGLTGDLQTAEDLAQTAFAKAYASWWRVRRADDPDAYVRRIVVNANRNRFRKTRVSELLTDSLPESSAADEVGRRDDRAILIRELMRLSHGQRAAVVLRYWLDLSEAETAAVLGCSVGQRQEPGRSRPGQAQDQCRAAGRRTAVSIQDEGQLQVRLGSLLDEIEPAPGAGRPRWSARAGHPAAPAGGRGGRRRRESPPPPCSARRCCAASCPRRRLAPAQHYNVTVSPPAQGARPGVIATGSINGWHWQATLSGTGDKVGVTFGTDFPADGVGVRAGVVWRVRRRLTREGGGASRTAYVGPVAARPGYLTVTLANGQMLTLYPQSWAGHRYVAMVLPGKLRVVRGVAYGADGILGYAIPFNYGGSATFQTWLRPGQTGPTEATARIGSGGRRPEPLDLRRRTSGRGACAPRCTSRARTGRAGSAWTSTAGRGSDWCPGSSAAVRAGWKIGLNRDDVAYLLVTRSDGSVVRVTVAHVPGYPVRTDGGHPARHPSFTSWVAVRRQRQAARQRQGRPGRIPLRLMSSGTAYAVPPASGFVERTVRAGRSCGLPALCLA